MSGGLLPETVRLLRDVRQAAPLFSNMVLAESFAADVRRGPVTVLPRTDGRFALIDERRAVGDRTVSTHPSKVAAIIARDELLGVAPKGRAA